MLRITPYTPSDFQALLQLNIEDQQDWWHITSEYQKQDPTTWDELTPFERYVHGGPWLDPQTLTLHIKTLYESSGTIFLAKDENTLVGEIEIATGTHHSFTRPESHKKTHLIWFLVHPSHRRKGIGKALFSKALSYTKSIQASYLQTEPEDERSQHFYEKHCTNQANKLIFTINQANWEPKGHTFSYNEIRFNEFSTQAISMPRLIGTFYTTQYDLYRVKHVYELHEILQDQHPLFKLIRIKLEQNKFAYAILSSRPRLWVPRGLEQELVKHLIAFLVEETFLYGLQEVELQFDEPTMKALNIMDSLPSPEQIIPTFFFTPK